jgi:hypothetical protein
VPALPRALAAALGRALASFDDRHADAAAFGDALVAAARADAVPCGPEVLVDAVDEPTNPHVRR